MKLAITETQDGQQLVFTVNRPRIPPLLHTCHAARDIGRKKYLELPTTKGKIWFDPDVDTICFGHSCHDKVSVMKWLGENTKVRHLEFRMLLFHIWCPDWRQHFFDVFHQYNNLEEVIFFAEAPSFLYLFLKVFGEEVGKVPRVKFVVRKKPRGAFIRMGRDEHKLH
jgi:hypothetical protein